MPRRWPKSSFKTVALKQCLRARFRQFAVRSQPASPRIVLDHEGHSGTDDGNETAAREIGHSLAQLTDQK